MIDTEAFERAVSEACNSVLGGIGTYNEKTQHRALKYYLEPDSDYHEVAIDSFVADVFRDGHIFEIQTSGFKALCSKLEVFLSKYKVTVIYPVVASKTIYWTDKTTGEVTAGNRVSRSKAKFKLFSELVHINEYISHENLRIMVIETEAREYRMLDGRGADKKIKATKVDMIPTRILSATEINDIDDLKVFGGFIDGEEFDRDSIYKKLSLKGRNAANAFKALQLLHILEFDRNVGRKRIYVVK